MKIIVPRILEPFDKETIRNFVKETGKLLAVYKIHKIVGWGV